MGALLCASDAYSAPQKKWLFYRVTLPNSILPIRPIRAMVEEDRVVEAEHREIVQNWMGFVNEGVEPLADLLPEHIVKKNGRP